MALMRIWNIRTSWKTYNIGTFTCVLEDGREDFGYDCFMSRLASTCCCCCDNGWLFPPPLYYCKWLCNMPCRRGLAPSCRHRNEVLLPLSFQSVFQQFCLQRVSLLYEYQVTSALGWLPAKLHIGCVAQEPSPHCLHKDLCQVGFSTEMLWSRFRKARRRCHS